MTVQDSNPRQRRRSIHDQQRAFFSLQGILEAGNALNAVKRHGTEAEVHDAQRRLQIAVDEARDAGASWTQIGDILKIRRGNAYQRFRHRHDGEN